MNTYEDNSNLVILKEGKCNTVWNLSLLLHSATDMNSISLVEQLG
jgi:hypothetical protein